jgi:hypothetical protein
MWLNNFGLSESGVCPPPLTHRTPKRFATFVGHRLTRQQLQYGHVNLNKHNQAARPAP